MKSGVVVREATTDDVAAIADFFHEAWRQAGPEAPGFAGATEEVIAEIAAPDTIAARLGGPQRRMFIARHDDRVIGFAATRRLTAELIELAGVVVLQSLIGGGIGSALFEAAVASARSHDFRGMTVSTETDNERAVRFYERCGFTITGKSATDAAGAEIEVWDLEMDLRAAG
jgi:N-acetylglutamate synthase-like GNAT family acetyltransferase